MNNDLKHIEKSLFDNIDIIKGQISIVAKSVRYTLVFKSDNPDILVEKLKIMPDFNGFKIISVSIHDSNKLYLGLLDINLINEFIHCFRAREPKAVYVYVFIISQTGPARRPTPPLPPPPPATKNSPVLRYFD